MATTATAVPMLTTATSPKGPVDVHGFASQAVVPALGAGHSVREDRLTLLAKRNQADQHNAQCPPAGDRRGDHPDRGRRGQGQQPGQRHLPATDPCTWASWRPIHLCVLAALRLQSMQKRADVKTMSKVDCVRSSQRTMEGLCGTIRVTYETSLLIVFVAYQSVIRVPASHFLSQPLGSASRVLSRSVKVHRHGVISRSGLAAG